MVAFNNIKTDEELDKFFDKIDNRLTLLKKLINTVSDITEKKIINNVIKSNKFVLDHIAFDKNVSYSDSYSDSNSDSNIESNSKQKFSDSELQKEVD